MFEIQNYNSFIFAVLLFQIYPGAGTVTILNATARGGIRGGMKAVFGTLTGDFIYMLSAVLGLASILAAYPSLLNLAQWIGAIYLLWIGFNFIRAPKNELKNYESGDWAFYRQGFAVSLTNPKAIMFFMAFFPLFLDVGSGPLTLVVIMAHVSIISLLYQSGLVFIGNVTIQRLSSFRCFRVIAARLTGLAIMGFGIKLLLNKR